MPGPNSNTLPECCPSCSTPRDQIQSQVETLFCPVCQFPLLCVAGKYRLLRLVGEGGFGRVYEAEHIKLPNDARRIIKLIRPEFLSNDTVVKRFEREVLLTSALSQRSPHIVRVFDDFGQIPNLGFFYVMEFLAGQTLRSFLQKKQTLPLSFVGHLFTQLCRAMDDAHQADVVHRDLKPENLLLIQQGRDDKFLKVIDFGIASHMQEDKSKTPLTQGALGTPSYMSPEQCLNKRLDGRSDIYAMGCILFELLVGYAPFNRVSHGDTVERNATEIIQAHLYEEPHPPSLLNNQGNPIHPAFDPIVLKAMQKRPGLRYENAHQMEKDFQDALREAMLIQAQMPKVAPSGSSTTSHPSSPPSSFVTLDPNTTLEPQMTQGAFAVSSIERSAERSTERSFVPEYETPKEGELSLVPPDVVTSGESPQPPSPYSSFEQRLVQQWQSKAGFWSTLGALALLFGVGVWWMLPSNKTTNKTSRSGMVGARQNPRRTPHRKTQPRKRPVPQHRSLDRTQVPANRTLPPQRKRSTSQVRRTPPVRKVKVRRRSVRFRRRVRRRVSPRPRLPRYVRYVSDCPKLPFRWTRLVLSPQQHKKAQAYLSRGKLVRKKDGYCVGVTLKKGRLKLEGPGVIPCSLSASNLATTLQVRLLMEGMPEPTSQQYCIVAP